MKKLIYLPIIAAIALSSCKSNSFMSQRYTKFGHSANKSAEKSIVSNKPVKTPVLVAEKMPEKNDILLVSASSSMQEVALKPQTNFKALTIANTEQNVSVNSNLQKTEAGQAQSTKSFTKKVTQQKASHARGLIGAALSLVITIIVIVVVVALILILVALV